MNAGKVLPRVRVMRDSINKVYWDVQTLSSMLCISPGTLRFWLKELGMEIKRSRRGHRQFVSADVDYLMAIAPFMRKGKAELAIILVQLKQNLNEKESSTKKEVTQSTNNG